MEKLGQQQVQKDGVEQGDCCELNDFQAFVKDVLEVSQYVQGYVKNQQKIFVGFEGVFLIFDGGDEGYCQVQVGQYQDEKCQLV